MKKILSILALFCMLALAAPAAYAGDSPSIFALIYQHTTTPGDGFVAASPVKSGSATCRNIFFIVATGNCSVKQAMKNGGITQLSHYDVEKESILGFQMITVKAYGR